MNNEGSAGIYIYIYIYPYPFLILDLISSLCTRTFFDIDWSGVDPIGTDGKVMMVILLNMVYPLYLVTNLVGS